MISIRPIFRHYLAEKWLKKLVPPPAKLIDIGCGRGDLDFRLAEKKRYEMECFEFSEAAVSEFRKIQKKNPALSVKLNIVDFLDWKENHQADAALCFEVLEHIEDDSAALRKIRAWLKEGGHLFLSVPAHMKKWGKDDEIFGHFRRYEKTELLKLLEKNGFETIIFYSYGFPWLNILKKIREVQVRLKPPKFDNAAGKNAKETGTRHSGVGFFKSNALGFLFNRITFYPLILIGSLFNHLDLSDGYFVVARKSG